MQRPVATPPSTTCPACGHELELVHVHGHGQCAHCGSNVEPCCQGAGDEADARDEASHVVTASTDHRGVRQVLDQLGRNGPSRRGDLLNALAAAHGVSLDEAEAWLVVAEQVGAVAVLAPDVVSVRRDATL